MTLDTAALAAATAVTFGLAAVATPAAATANPLLAEAHAADLVASDQVADGTPTALAIG